MIRVTGLEAVDLRDQIVFINICVRKDSKLNTGNYVLYKYYDF